MNTEQRQILNALRNNKSKYVLVDGPPGTGKSHSITAIAFRHILERKSILILLIKEALDVVEDKLVHQWIRFELEIIFKTQY